MNLSAALKRLPVPDTVGPKINWGYAVTILGGHVAALLALHPYFFHWSFPILTVLGVHLFGQGITIGYHRLLTHRSFRTPRWVERALALLGICCLQDTPVRWVSTHRMHHVHTDEQPDPHTPRVSFFWSHFAWLFYENGSIQSIAGMDKYARDLVRDPFYLWLEKNRLAQVAIVLGQAAIVFAVGFAFGAWWNGIAGGVQTGAGLVVWGVFVRTVLVWHITWSVNSLSHMFGYRNYETDEDSRNNWLVALLTVGEGWHNNHHEDPSSASVQHRWWEIDISYYEILLLERLGLAWDVIPVRARRQAGRAAAKENAPANVVVSRGAEVSQTSQTPRDVPEPVSP